MVRSLLQKLEQRYSRYRPDSLVSMINRRAGSKRFTPVDEETLGLLDFAEQLWKASEGLFDITSGPLRRAWHFQGVGCRDPSKFHLRGTCWLASRKARGSEHSPTIEGHGNRSGRISQRNMLWIQRSKR